MAVRSLELICDCVKFCHVKVDTKLIPCKCQAVQVNHMLHLSGQLGMNPETMDFVGDDIQDQTKQALKNMGNILEAAGSSFKNVVETTILLADIKDYKAVNDIYATYFTEPFPARAAYECANLPKYAKVEIKAMAIVGEVDDK